MSINWQLDVDPAPALLVLPPAAASLDEAHAAIELWEHYSRKTLDPAQRLVVEVMMAETADGRWAAATTGREMPRQNGKGDEIEVVELWGLVQRDEAILHTVHDAVLLATQAQQRMLGVLEGHPDLRRKVKRKWQGTGQQMIEMRGGGTIWYRTRTGGGGRGVDDVDRVVIDEAQHATNEHVEALSPTLLANSNPQMNIAGTAGISGRSSWWWGIRKRALISDPGSFGYVGHSAERVWVDDHGRVRQDPIDIEDRTLWRQANPAIAAGRGGGMDFLEEQFLRLSRDGFAREHLGRWDPEPSSGAGDIDMTVWQDLAIELDDAGRPVGSRPDPVALAVTVSPDRRWGAIGLAGRREDGITHIQIVKSAEGTGWLVPELVRLRDRWSARVGIVPTSPAGSLLAELAEAGVDAEELSVAELARGCAAMFDAIAQRKVRHQDQGLLNIAAGAAMRVDRGKLWLWGSARSATDVTPLECVTIAMAVLHSPAKVKQRSGRVW